ncbi:hypothetical protein Ae201684P_002629 [Aphanomyces euteiches]|nr:hypothetical protein Ae201684P_002629 [Aphanomyces euteiches]
MSSVLSEEAILLPKGSVGQRRPAVWAILIMNIANWFAYYGITQAFKNFMEDKLHYSKISACTVRSTWTAFSSIVPLFGAYIGDERWGRYLALEFFTAWFVGGAGLVALSAHPTILTQYLPLANVVFLVSLFAGIAVGVGVFHPNIVSFGADQASALEASSKELFFSQYYLTANLGMTIAYTCLAYLSVNGMGQWIPLDYGYFATFLIAGAILVVALVIFSAYSSTYVKANPRHGAFTEVFSSMVESMKDCPELGFIVSGFGMFALSFHLNVVAILLPPTNTATTVITWIAGICVLLGMGSWIVHTLDVSFIDSHETLPHSVRSDLKQLLRMLLLACFHVMWQCVLDQMDVNFQSIAQQSDLRLASGRLAPGARSKTPTESKMTKLSPFDKMATGYILAAFTMLWTAWVETWRRESGEIDLADGLGPLLDLGTHKPMNNLSWLYIAVSYLLSSLCECLINIPSYEMFYTYVPLHWKSSSQAMRSFMLALGANVASIFTLVFARDIPDDLNQGHLENMYYCMAVVAAINAAGFLYVIKTTNFVQAIEESFHNSKLQEES